MKLHTTPLPTFDDFSRYRNFLMGFAALWVLLLHFSFDIPVYNKLVGRGFIGVDIFLLVSGFGLFFSLQKNLGLWDFYQKRISRIFPTYFVVVTTFALLAWLPIQSYLWEVTGLGYYFGKPSFDWYIPSLLLLYAISPIYKRFVIDRKSYVLINSILIATSILLAVILLASFEIPWPKVYFISRVPIFFMGFFCGYACCKQYSATSLLAIAAGSLIIFLMTLPVIRTVYWQFLTNSFFAIPICYILVYVIRILPRRFIRIIEYCGIMSLEIYLIHIGMIHSHLCDGLQRGYKLIPIVTTLLTAPMLHYSISYIKQRVLCYK